MVLDTCCYCILLRAEDQKCQECEVLHRLTLCKVLETGTELETESFVLGLIHRFQLFNFSSAAAAASFWNISGSASTALAGVRTCSHRHTRAALPQVLLQHNPFHSPSQLKSGVLRWLLKEASSGMEFPKLPRFLREWGVSDGVPVSTLICRHSNIWQIIGFHCIMVV